MKNGEAKMGVVQAFYGKCLDGILWYGAHPDVAIAVGALVAPLIATQFAKMPHWSLHYAVTAGLGLLNLASILIIFRLKSQERQWL
jgi:MFS family permease